MIHLSPCGGFGEVCGLGFLYTHRPAGTMSWARCPTYGYKVQFYRMVHYYQVMMFRLHETKKLTHFPHENGGLTPRVVQVACLEDTGYGVCLLLY